ncbi:MAG: NAD(+) diphosphatase, partial [Gammaproteobacteria bacterium]|nr:NAD(+) diphosphatase [Gammaproteobacteria bacterium]
MGINHTFSGNPLDRGDNERRDPVWLAKSQSDYNSRFLPFWQLNVLVQQDSDLTLGWLNADRLDATINTPPVFLGLRDNISHFAVDVSDLENPIHILGLDDSWRFEDARMAAMVLSGDQSGILAQGRSQIDWHNRHRFCGACGVETAQARGGHLRKCPNCNAEHFPRTDPVAIMLIVDDERCLLGQSAGRLARTGMYSALAGFIDQGESIEEAVRREVLEESGVKVGEVSYHSSQPWPFPSSLMIGCHGKAISTDIRINSNEMADVRWFPRDDVLQALRQEHPTLKVPGAIAISHHFIKD